MDCIVAVKQASNKDSGEHLPHSFVHPAVEQAGCPPPKRPLRLSVATEPQTGTLDTVQWCLLNANAPGGKKKSPKIASFVFVWQWLSKPLFDHSPWIRLSQSYTFAPTVIRICSYLKGKARRFILGSQISCKPNYPKQSELFILHEPGVSQCPYGAANNLEIQGNSSSSYSVIIFAEKYTAITNSLLDVLHLKKPTWNNQLWSMTRYHGVY